MIFPCCLCGFVLSLLGTNFYTIINIFEMFAIQTFFIIGGAHLLRTLEYQIIVSIYIAKVYKYATGYWWMRIIANLSFLNNRVYLFIFHNGPLQIFIRTCYKSVIIRKKGFRFQSCKT